MVRMLALFATALLLSAVTCMAKPKTMSLQVKNGQLREEPSFLSPVRASVEYGDRLNVVREKGPWTEVCSVDGKIQGWIHSSALTKKRIRLRAGEKDADLAASSSELALAGKGFNSDVESEFKTRNADVDFSWVDKMEKTKIPAAEIAAFLKNGGVTPNGDVQ